MDPFPGPRKEGLAGLAACRYRSVAAGQLARENCMDYGMPLFVVASFTLSGLACRSVIRWAQPRKAGPVRGGAGKRSRIFWLRGFRTGGRNK